jgi:hypothetical protein
MEATMLHLPGSLEPQLRLSVALCEMAHQDSSVAAQLMVDEERLWAQWRRPHGFQSSTSESLGCPRKTKD